MVWQSFGRDDVSISMGSFMSLVIGLQSFGRGYGGVIGFQSFGRGYGGSISIGCFMSLVGLKRLWQKLY